MHSHRRSVFFDRLQDLVSEIPIFRYSDEAMTVTTLAGLPEGGITTGPEINVQPLIDAYEMQTDADKRLIRAEWSEFLDALTGARIGATGAYLSAHQIAQLLGVRPANGHDLSLADHVLKSVAGTITTSGPDDEIDPVVDAVATEPAAPVEADPIEIDALLNGGQVYLGPQRGHRWQLASAALLMACVGLLAHVFFIGHFDYVAATERIPLSDIPVLETLDIPSTADVSIEPTMAVVPPALARVSGEQAGTTMGASVAAQPPAHKLAKRPRTTNKREHMKVRQRVIAAGSIDTFIIEPPARTGQLPIRVTVKPHAPRRIDTTPETARRIQISDTAEFVHLEVIVRSEVIDPEGKAAKRATMRIEWIDE